MQVKAKYQIGYNNILYKGGDIFEMSETDYKNQYSGDVDIYVAPDFRKKVVTKPVKKVNKK
jgi:hypothetical protein